MPKITNILLWLKPKFLTIFLVFVTVCYFSIGIFNTVYFGPTVDEFAHIGATQSNSRGIANNGEHPILLKSLNAAWLRLFYSDFTPTEVEQYKLGNQFLMESKYKGLDILRSSRLIYLIFNFLPIAIFYLLVTRRLMDKSIFIWFSTFYVFSVSILSNSNLLTFDIAGSWTALLFIVLNYILFQKYSSVSIYNKLLLSSLFVLTFSLALNTKFSNITLLPILAIFNLGAIAYSVIHKSKKFYLYYFLTTLAALSFFYLSILFLYRFAFGNSTFVYGRHSVLDKNVLFSKYYDFIEFTNKLGKSVQVIMNPVKWYMAGLGSVFLRTTEPSHTSFFHKLNINKTFLEYNLGLIPYKENPVILIAGVSVLPVIIWQTIKKRLKDFRSYIVNLEHFMILAIFPLIYLMISKDSKLTIGYRHFTPIMIFIYFGLSILFAKYFSKLFSGIIIAGIILMGLIGFNQNLSYVNFFWNDQKWLLVNDSSYNWGQENYRAIKFVYDNYYQDLLSAKSEDLIISSFGSANFGKELSLIDKNIKNPNLDKKTLEPEYFTKNLIDDRSNYKEHSKIVIIDSEVIQKLYLCQNNNPICKANFNFFNSVTPAYTNNQVIFVYKL